jgi:hypothetical protein
MTPLEIALIIVIVFIIMTIVAHFKCGHWCTNNVFDDLIDLSTGFAKWNNPQLKLKI